MKKGLIFNIQRYSLHDGPGIRTTLFLKGCPLHCWWCHNPESQKQKIEFLYRKDRCIGCTACSHTCPVNAITIKEVGLIRNEELCIQCGKCQQACFVDAIEWIGKEMTVHEVMDEIKRDILFYDESKGGITLSGGEPLMQPEFAIEVLKKCKAENIHTAVDTCGYAPWDILVEVQKYADLFLFDIKHMDNEQHKKYTGVSNRLILSNLKKLSLIHPNIVIRIPIIPGINDDHNNLYETGKFIASLGIKQVHILPYHNIGIAKYQRMGLDYLQNDLSSPNDKSIQDIQSLGNLWTECKKGG